MLALQKFAEPMTFVAIGAGFLLQSYYPIPQVSELTAVTGPVRVTEVDRDDQSFEFFHFATVTIQNQKQSLFQAESFGLLRWYPNATSLPYSLHNGQIATVWKDSFGYPWQIEQGGQVLLSHASMCDAVAAEHRQSPYWALVCMILGIGILAVVLVSRNVD